MVEEKLTIALDGQQRLACGRLPGRAPTVVFLGGFASDMTGTKASFLLDHCRRRGQAFCRFDYRGHGQSSGRFEDGTIGLWLEDTLALLDRAVEGRFILTGSSMGGWLMLLAGLARKERLAGLLGIAPAPDFTHRLIEPGLTPEEKAVLERDGRVERPSDYGPSLTFTRALLEEGRRHALLDGPIELDVPTHILQGQADPDVPFGHALELASRLQGGRVTVELVKDGDHRLSRPEDLKRLGAALDRLIEAAGGAPNDQKE